MAVGVEELAQRLNRMGREVIFLGDGVPVYRDLLEQCVTVKHSYAPAHLNKQRAGAVAALGMIYARQGKLQTAAEHQPDYLRLSQAERERAEKKAEKAHD